MIGHLGGVAQLTGQTLRCLVRRPVELRALVRQIDLLGIGSTSVTLLTAIFTGMVMALQFSVGLEPYGASLYTGKLVSLGIVRELGPVLTALLVGGRVGSGITAEIGSMSVTEQVDAIRALGADPVKRLVLPRVLACVISLPLLTMVADIVGVLGGMIITMQEVGITWRFFLNQLLDTIWAVDLLHGLGKSVFFGYIIGIVGCYMGMRTTGGTAGVGRNTTATVVIVSISILVSDYLLTNLFLAIYG
ncbi:MAG: ABC transporter permease [Deltaproteobacteria bacterium]|nr:ABC transporter permease [Deltaproteobacteria bacterium]